MALGAVLVDRARTLARAPSGAAVDGTTPMGPVAGEWFKARLFLAGAPSSVNRGRLEALPAPQLLYAVRDLAGGAIVLHFDEKVQVSSTELGDAVWELTNEPEPLRKRRRIIGYLANLQRVEEREFLPLAGP